ncbi:hypothetical protein Pan216_28780 [Planctomycetes bacterium Pan216]|uniref:ATP-dependent RecD-like DNA helicase n=1 Tax=Kolteria novifilia TaxID=2527975 RepID=A0A518B4Y0_9BACT|nr:hypothetical protein Pan216_28780 [Planctomycetes bacterium Pan216]
MSQHRRVLDHFHERLLGAITRSTLLKATATRSGRIVDCFRFDSVAEGMGQQLLRAIVDDKGTFGIDLQLRLRSDAIVSAEGEESFSPSPDAERVREHRRLHDQLDRRLKRYADLLRRETGVHSLWIGYPLLYVVAPDDDRLWSLAPVFLWPLEVRLDRSREGRVLFKRDASAGPPKFNRAMAGWIRRQLGVSLSGPTEDELDDLRWRDLSKHLDQLALHFRDPPSMDLESPLEPLPKAKLLNPQHSPRLLNTAVVGVFRGQHEATLAEIEEIRDLPSIDGVASGFTSGTALPPAEEAIRPHESDRFQVYDADFSQERVIWQSRQEPGLVVHGPPGTGKSQTIVNVIADALAHGRTVLMVCQKHAATRVVFEKLKQVGLDGLCLEVADTEKSRLPVFRAIRDQVETLGASSPNGSPTTRERLSEQIHQLEEELDTYARVLHEADEAIGLSYRELKALEGATFRQFPTVRPFATLQRFLTTTSSKQLDVWKPRIEEAGRLFAQARPLTNPWRQRASDFQMIASVRDDVSNAVAELRRRDKTHLEHIANAGAGVAISGSPEQFAELATRVEQKLRTLAAHDDSAMNSDVLRCWLRERRDHPSEPRESQRDACEDACQLADEVVQSPIDPGLDQHCGELNERQLKQLDRNAKTALDHEGRWWRWMSFSFRHARHAIRQLEPDADDVAVWELSREIRKYVHARRLRIDLAARNRQLVPGFAPAEDELAQIAFPPIALEELTTSEFLTRHESDHPWLAALMVDLEQREDRDWIEATRETLRQSLDRLPLLKSLFEGFSALDPFFEQAAFEVPHHQAREGNSIHPWLDEVISGLDRIDDLLAWSLFWENRDDPLLPLVSLLQAYEQSRISNEQVPQPPSDLSEASYGTWWVALVIYSASLAWQRISQRKSPILVSMTPEAHASKVEQLQQRLAEKRRLEAEVILTNWKARQSPHKNAAWKRMFQMRRSKYGEAKRLREAIALSLPEGLLAMRPCWLVNPATVSELFPLRQGLFDVVVFDEASQCPLELAIPAIFRGRTVVVSGDEKQLPPTSFFSSRWDEDDRDDEDEPASDQPIERQQQLEHLGVDHLLHAGDLLTAAIGTLPERYLRVHYRSRHPALIEFSNRAFYGDRLEAPPAQVSSLNGRQPIRYLAVEGEYRGRVNRREAESVVETLRELWMSQASPPTVGVVTFNQPQRELIEDVLEEACASDDELDAHYKRELAREEEGQDVGFFIKNLENVQGDERDVMIFSTTFGRDTEGRFYRRFGPVGAVGGERRLNVAVTRAKRQVIIVSSMPINDVANALTADASDESALTPAAYLQLYLAYAKAVSEDDLAGIAHVLQRTGERLANGASTHAPSSIENDVAQTLEHLGFSTQGPIGSQGFQIDVGVLSEPLEQGFTLGIECDGPRFDPERSARLREVWRAGVLRSRGWNLYSLWSTQWWGRRSDVVNHLQRMLTDLMRVQSSENDE